ncbi:recombinase family protein [Paraburkholderia sp. JPY465]|uniref:recombinase family protein n=1 Tax=Paraburkholderia sp. JPY465 TaxID=3042285 RepID=UPI003D25F589
MERLRDAAALGTVDRLYILAPDRLARKYAHQALLMEEFSSCGVQIVFLNHAIGTTPEESLLLQMQGMIAEYERAKIAERHRRGKLHGAKAVPSMCYQGRLTATAISEDSSTGRQPGTLSNCRKQPL